MAKNPNYKKHPDLYQHDFKIQGSEPTDTSPICVRLPISVAAYVRSQSDRSRWLVEAAFAKMQSELEANRDASITSQKTTRKSRSKVVQKIEDSN